MRAIEALERGIALSDELLDLHPSQRPENVGEQWENDKVAVSILQAMVNTAIPIARWRIHAELKNVHRTSKMGECDFTVCGTSIASVKAGIVGLMREDGEAYVTLWEQTAKGAEMMSGYQGLTSAQNFRNWFRQLDQFQVEPTVQ